MLLAFWAGQLALAMHAPETAHRVCEEHGELVDDAGAAHLGGEPAHTPAATEIASAQRDAPHAGHEHCPFGTLLQQTGSLASLAPPVSAAPPHLVHLVAVAPRAPSGTPIPLYRLAPKTSPPA